MLVMVPVSYTHLELYEQKTEEWILVQGIIDVYFEEEDGLVVLDYKTDRVSDEKELVNKYHAQLDYYAKALEQLTEKKVKEKLIYSFALGKEIRPVSYTHLDVYKRQLYGCSASAGAEKTSGEGDSSGRRILLSDSRPVDRPSKRGRRAGIYFERIKAGWNDFS